MSKVLLRGDIVYARALGELTALRGGYIALDGCNVAGVFADVPPRMALWDVEDLDGALILPAPVDVHLHAPQYPILGTGMDMQLLDWLNTYVFKAEARFADPGYAREMYARLAKELVNVGTTRAVLFSSLHAGTTPLLMEALERAGITALVGKVNMDRNSPADYIEQTGRSLEDTRRWIEDSLGAYRRVRPIVTPRFIPSCTDELMRGLRLLREQYHLPAQSHLSENADEVAWVKSLCPDCADYAAAYEKDGFLGPDVIMAHCVLSDAREIERLRRTRTLVAHCPDSNVNLSSGIAPVRKMLDAGVRVALASDIAGGAQISMFGVMASAIRVSKLRRLYVAPDEAPLTAREALYLATAQGAAFFGGAPLGVGGALDALVIRDGARADMSLEERLERAIYELHPHWIERRYAAGQRV